MKTEPAENLDLSGMVSSTKPAWSQAALEVAVAFTDVVAVACGACVAAWVSATWGVSLGWGCWGCVDTIWVVSASTVCAAAVRTVSMLGVGVGLGILQAASSRLAIVKRIIVLLIFFINSSSKRRLSNYYYKPSY